MIATGGVALGIFFFSILITLYVRYKRRSITKRRNSTNKKVEELKPLNEKGNPNGKLLATSLLFSAKILLLFLALSTIMSIITLAFAIKEKQLHLNDFLFTSHIWKPIIRMDVTIGVTLIIPMLHLLVNYIPVANHPPRDGRFI